MQGFDSPLSRREALRRGAGAAIGLSSALAATRVPIARSALRAAARKPIPLPSPHHVARDFRRMVDFGPRLTGSASHNRYIAWLEREFVKAGLRLEPCDVYETLRWQAKNFGLDVLEGSGAGRVKVGTYYPRSHETPAGGVTGPLVYGGTAPAPRDSPAPSRAAPRAACC